MGGGTSKDSPRQPAFWRFAGVGVGGGGGLDACAHTLAVKSASYRARLASTCCFAPGADVDVGVDAAAWWPDRAGERLTVERFRCGGEEGGDALGLLLEWDTDATRADARPAVRPPC
jgi:hypothetical protein